MGYDIRPIEEIDTFDYYQCVGYPQTNKDTVTRSLDNTLFIVEGENINAYTQSEMEAIKNSGNWNLTIE